VSLTIFLLCRILVGMGGGELKKGGNAPCVFLASGFGWGAVMHEIPISSAPS
jgi:hypothetical protein